MSRSQDLFPTRLERKLGMFERLDPVVHTPEERLPDGPLSTEQVREFDERGFLLFDSFFSKEEMDGFIKELKDYEEDEDLKLSEGTILEPGFKGKGFNWHSDFETWHSEDGMPRMRCLSCSIVMTDNNEFNGPLMLIPSSQKYFIPCVGRTPVH